MIRWLRCVFALPCRHDTTWVRRHWVSDGTAMWSFHCVECGYRTQGHACLSTENWTAVYGAVGGKRIKV